MNETSNDTGREPGSEPGSEPGPANFHWRDEYLLGYPPMDNMHREFVIVVEALMSCEQASMGAGLRAVACHLDEHFGEENRWMNEMDFPARGCHIDEHAAVRKSVDEVLALVDAGDLSQVIPLAQALVNWFPGHADYLDSALSAWISKQRTGGKPVVLRRNLDLAREA